MITKRIVGALAAVAALTAAGCGGDDETDGAAADASPSETGMPMDDEPTADTEPAEDQTEPAENKTEAATDETEEPATETEPPDEDADVQVDESSTVGIAETSLGTILVDGKGRTLYMFDADDQGASTCYDDCAADWPPVTDDGEPVGGESIDEALLGTTERDDGSRQVTYNDWPLYRWNQDGEPGAVNGQGVSGVWWAIGPDGTPIRE